MDGFVDGIRASLVRLESNHRKRRLARAYFFFREHAGYVVGRAAECAFALAKAELAAHALGWECFWEEDSCTSAAECDEHDADAYVCVLRDADGRVLTSLGGILLARRCAPGRDPYTVVIEAELALEAIEEHATQGAAELAARATYAG